jgi:hypothetical protein
MGMPALRIIDVHVHPSSRLLSAGAGGPSYGIVVRREGNSVPGLCTVLIGG